MPNILTGTNAALKIIDANGTERDMTSYWIAGMPAWSDESVDVTAIGDSARRNNPGLETATQVYTFLFDASGTASPWPVLTGLHANNSTARNVLFYPQGDSSSRPEVILPSRCIRVSPAGGVGEVETIEAEFVIDGTRTVGTV